MKKLLIALRVSVIFILIVSFGSCDPRSGGVGGGGTIPPPVAAKINNVTTSPSSAFTLTGMPVNTAVTFVVDVVGNPTPTLTVNNVSFSGTVYNAPASYNTSSYNFVASNSAGSGTWKSDIVITVHPTFAQIVGADSVSWLLTSITGRPVGSNDPPFEYITPCQKTWVYTFRKDLACRDDHGACGGGVSRYTTFKFDISSPTPKILDNLSSSFTWQDVTFATGKMMFTSIKDGMITVRTYNRL